MGDLSGAAPINTATWEPRAVSEIIIFPFLCHDFYGREEIRVGTVPVTWGTGKPRDLKADAAVLPLPRGFLFL